MRRLLSFLSGKAIGSHVSSIVFWARLKTWADGKNYRGSWLLERSTTRVAVSITKRRRPCRNTGSASISSPTSPLTDTETLACASDSIPKENSDSGISET